MSIFKSIPSLEVLHLLCVSRASSSESKRTLAVPGRCFGGFWHGGCLKDTSRKLHINFQISTCLGSAPYPMCLQIVIMESKRTLEVPERSLGGLWDGGWLKDTSRKLHINFQVSTPMESCPMRRYELSVSEGVSEWVKFSFIELHTQLKMRRAGYESKKERKCIRVKTADELS